MKNKKQKSRINDLMIITLIVSIKLLLSYFIPGLKTPGELVWTGGILLFFTVKTFLTYDKDQ